MPNRLANDGEGCSGGGLHSAASIMTEKNRQKETGYSGKTLISFGTKLRRGGGSVTLEHYHGSARILGEVRTEMRTR